ncbi:MAG: response regulator [Candidatus Eremiobacteraeota bacterium]|nr:response regulator [Candidatus Eremiobacteraeota bacterium]
MEPSLDQVIQTLQELRARLQASHLPMMYFESDERGCLLRLEGEVELLLGSPATVWLGKRLESLWQSGPWETSPASLHNQVVTREETRQRFWVRLADSQAGYRGVLLDCSQQQVHDLEAGQLLLTLQQQQKQLSELELAVRQRQAFALVFSREVRTLVHRMLGLLEMVRHKPQPQSLDGLQVSLEHLLALSGPLQDALGPAWTVEPQPVEFDLHQTVAQVAAWLNSEARAKVIEIHCTVSDSIPRRLLGDVVKLRQILLQLLDNAVKFTAGDVIVDVSGSSEVLFCIQDTGPGMSAAKIESLFQGSLLSGDLPTTGLGIKLARHLVELLRGKIWVDSQPEVGTSFYFSLNFATQGPAPVLSAPPESGRLRVLLAEDDAVCQKVALRILNSMGHRVDIVSNGLDVLEVLQRGVYDVVLLDVEMPALDGLETARQIHRRFTPAPYLIALTAGNSAADRRKVMLAGMQDFLAKPLRAEELADALTQIHL